MQIIRVVIIGDFASSALDCLAWQEDIEIVGIGESWSDAIAMTGQFQPDVLLIDAEMPDAGRMDALHAIKQSASATEVIVLSGAADDHTPVSDPQTGEYAVCLRQCAIADLTDSLRAASRGDNADCQVGPFQISKQRHARGRRAVNPIKCALGKRWRFRP